MTKKRRKISPDIAIAEGPYLARLLLDWHGGQGSGLYAVGSTLYSGQREPDNYSLRRAVSELRNLKKDANYPECVSAEDEAECNALADRLQELYPQAFTDEAVEEDYGKNAPA